MRYSVIYSGDIVVRKDENGDEQFIFRGAKDWKDVTLHDEENGVFFKKEVSKEEAEKALNKLGVKM